MGYISLSFLLLVLADQRIRRGILRFGAWQWRSALALLIVAAGLVSGIARAEAPLPTRLTIAPVPAWVVPRELNTDAPIDPRLAENGVVVLLHDRRAHVTARGEEHYTRSVRKAVTAAGVEVIAEIELEFEPQLERLAVHWIKRVRDGVTTDMAPSASTRFLQKETDLARRMYAGTATAYIVLSDVRKDDVIDLAYSISGSDPELEGQFADSFSLDSWAPAAALNVEISTSADRKALLAWRAHEGAPDPLPSADPHLLRWTRTDVRPSPDEDRVPGGVLGPHVEVADSKTWADVVGWEIRQYPVTSSKALQEQIAAIEAAETERDARILKAIRFVQDEIRYLAISVDQHGHKPHAPERVLTQRFGDCKDKTLLLLSMLRAWGIDAAPALVSTRRRERLVDRLPSSRAFDHVIVHLKLDGKERWIDPTWSHQGGDLWTQIEPAIGAALVLRPGTDAITVVPHRVLKGPEMEVWKDYTRGEDASADLTVTTRYSGREADSFRDDLARESSAALEQRYLNFWSREHPGAKLKAPLEIRDDRAANRIEVTEKYEVPSLWRGSAWESYGDTIERALSKPKVVTRRLPLSVPHPRWFWETQRIAGARLTDEETEALEVEDEAFLYTRRIEPAEALLSVTHEIRTTAGEVPAERTAEHVAKLGDVRSALAYRVSTSGEGERPGSPSVSIGPWVWGTLGVAGVIGLVFAYVLLSLWWRKFRFRRRRFGTTGDLATNPIRAKSAGEASAMRAGWRCACGARFNQATETSWSELRLGQELLHVMRLRCGACGAATSRYFKLDVPRIGDSGSGSASPR